MHVLTTTALALTAAMMLLSACETTEGFGRDTTKLGKNITGAAEKNDLDNDKRN